MLRANSLHGANQAGAAVFAAGQTSLIVSDTKFDGNLATTHVNQKGAGVYVASGATGTFSRVNFTNNVGAYGGGIYVAGKLSCFKDVTRSCTLWRREFGPIPSTFPYTLLRLPLNRPPPHNGSGTATFTDSEFSFNKANYAGAIYAAGSVTLIRTTIKHNTAFIRYGSICMAVNGNSTYSGYSSSNPPSFTFTGLTRFYENTGDVGSGCSAGQYITSFDMVGAQFSCASCPTGRSVSGVSLYKFGRCQVSSM